MNSQDLIPTDTNESTLTLNKLFYCSLFSKKVIIRANEFLFIFLLYESQKRTFSFINMFKISKNPFHIYNSIFILTAKLILSVKKKNDNKQTKKQPKIIFIL